MTKTLLLWDIDGTLLHTGGAGLVAMRRIFQELYGEDFQWGQVQTAGKLDSVIFAELAQVNRLRIDETQHQHFRERYVQELDRQLRLRQGQVRTMPGILPLLQTLRRRAGLNGKGDVILGLLTGNYAKAAPMKLRSAGIDASWFSIGAFGDQGPTRANLLAVALGKFQLLTGAPADPKRVIVIGDTPRDVACAHAHHCIAFAVATGTHTVAELQSAGADVVIEDLSDPTPLLTMIDH